MDSRKTYVQRHRDQGLCVKCPQKAHYGDYCERHWEIHLLAIAKYRVRSRKARELQGLCLICGIALDKEMDENRRICINCCGTTRLRPRKQGFARYKHKEIIK